VGNVPLAQDVALSTALVHVASQPDELSSPCVVPDQWVLADHTVSLVVVVGCLDNGPFVHVTRFSATAVEGVNLPSGVVSVSVVDDGGKLLVDVLSNGLLSVGIAIVPGTPHRRIGVSLLVYELPLDLLGNVIQCYVPSLSISGSVRARTRTRVVEVSPSLEMSEYVCYQGIYIHRSTVVTNPLGQAVGVCSVILDQVNDVCSG